MRNFNPILRGFIALTSLGLIATACGDAETDTNASADTNMGAPSTPVAGGGAPAVTPPAGGGAPAVTPPAGGGAPAVTPPAGMGTPAVTPPAGGGAPAVTPPVVTPPMVTPPVVPPEMPAAAPPAGGAGAGGAMAMPPVEAPGAGAPAMAAGGMPNMPAPAPEGELFGFASLSELGQDGTTGGMGGPEVTPTTGAELIDYIEQDGPLIIKIQGTIELPASPGNYILMSDKSILGVGADAKITGGGFDMGYHLWDQRGSLNEPPANVAHNVIIRNIHFDGPSKDALNFQLFSHHIWVDHCTFSNSPPGEVDGRAIDIKRGADFITLSNNLFESTINQGGIVGADPSTTYQEAGRTRVTMYYNWWNGLPEATHQVYHGQAHYLNNLWTNIGSYIIGIGKQANVFMENGVVEGTPEMFSKLVKSSPQGGVQDMGSIGVEPRDPEKVTLVPSMEYMYTALPTDAVKAHVMANAGAGKLTF